ncbi:twin-arginine translocation signal domain-containing protein [Tamlana sp. 2_MG-2023]|uniref:twin-arginine translocation signal domain-containing protein n=1 Tax=unclassified Tamlana TaxID=2614803 RepID=UPI0026E3BC0E|nr:MULTISPECIES: twin-arginine translocation signal domain-containing protein [unclassified Tamlana]MDO6761276.1 twin-arginine translocation signal domain-containing protein [Tamlana sp. 2_MG-2023]MDO6791759.1 twin-arginine translocation signal domain-containing protein [Tamlana sp. 1_MG-2023]
MSTRRNFLKKTGLATAAIASTPSFGFNILGNAAPKDEILGHGDYQYKVHREWAQISSIRNPILNCHEMVMDSKGRLIMMGDHPKNNILIFDKSGKLLDYWGTAYPGGHGLSLSKEGGEDFLLLTDSGWYLNKLGKWTKHNGRVSKTTTDGRVVFDIGHPQTIGVYKPGDHFCPTETAVGPNGDIYVADGYGMDYIIQYNEKGEYIRHWGGKDNVDTNYNLSNAHGVAIDYRDKNNPLVVCTSRNEQSFKWFTLDGKYVKTLHLPNMQVCRPVFDDNNLYAGVCWSQPKVGKTTWKEHTGFVTILEGDTVVSNPGGTAPEYKNGTLQKSYQLENKPILHGHDVCVDEDKNLYICQWNANKTAPLKLERV